MLPMRAQSFADERFLQAIGTIEQMEGKTGKGAFVGRISSVPPFVVQPLGCGRRATSEKQPKGCTTNRASSLAGGGTVEIRPLSFRASVRDPSTSTARLPKNG